MIFLCDRYTSNPYLQVSILRHGQIILTELNIQYQPVENRPFSKMMHFSFLWYLLIPLLSVLFFSVYIWVKFTVYLFTSWPAESNLTHYSDSVLLWESVDTFST